MVRFCDLNWIYSASYNIFLNRTRPMFFSLSFQVHCTLMCANRVYQISCRFWCSANVRTLIWTNLSWNCGYFLLLLNNSHHVYFHFEDVDKLFILLCTLLGRCCFVIPEIGSRIWTLNQMTRSRIFILC